MNAVPVWIQVLQALLTPAIAVAVAAIGFMQWRTAHTKVVLDLFDRRFRIYSRAVEIIETAAGVDATVFPDGLPDLAEEARLLFGAEVAECLDRMVKPLSEMGAEMFRARQTDHATRSRKNPYDDGDAKHTGDRTKEVWEQNKLKAQRLKAELLGCVSLYLRMEHKLIRTPTQYFEDRNRQRLSYADEKQR